MFGCEFPGVLLVTRYKKFIKKLTCTSVGWLEFAGLENDRLENDGLENDGLENDGLEQEQTCVLHTLKTFNVHDM